MSMPAGFPAHLRYVGFWARVGAALIDSALLLMLVVPLIYWM
jgi:hypothetical protein